jgi:hypothetical protein
VLVAAANVGRYHFQNNAVIAFSSYVQGVNAWSVPQDQIRKISIPYFHFTWAYKYNRPISSHTCHSSMKMLD